MRWSTKNICYMAVLLAAQIVLSRFCSFSVWNMKIGLAFIPVVICAILFGPWSAAIVSALGDFLGSVLFPIGPYFPGFTVTAFFSGLIWGLLHKKQTTARIILSVLLNQVLCSLLLNSLWISVLYTSPFVPLLATRAVQCAVMGPAQFLIILLLRRPLAELCRRVG